MKPFPPLLYIRQHPFSLMALCNIFGDLGFLGYAFASERWVSLPKLGGALFTLLAHTLLLAYGDDQAQAVAKESGPLSRLTLRLRRLAQSAVRRLPSVLHHAIKAKPVGISFSILALNGAGLFADALDHLLRHTSPSMLAQVALGCFIVLGTMAFAIADFVRGQKTADRLTRFGSVILACATCCTALLAVTTLNIFVIFSITLFLISNLAASFVRMDKGKKGEKLARDEGALPL